MRLDRVSTKDPVERGNQVTCVTVITSPGRIPNHLTVLLVPGTSELMLPLVLKCIGTPFYHLHMRRRYIPIPSSRQKLRRVTTLNFYEGCNLQCMVHGLRHNGRDLFYVVNGLVDTNSLDGPKETSLRGARRC